MDLKIKSIKVGRIRTNCYIVFDKNKEAFIVDPGGDADKIITELRVYNLNLKYILLTHAHFDHILALDEVKEAYPEAEVILGENDVKLLDEIVEQGIFTKQVLKPIKSEVTAHQEGDELNFGEKRIKIVETPGHTEGGVSYLIDNLLFSGDTLFYHTYGRVDLPHSDAQKMRESLRKLLYLPENTKVYPGHGKTTTIKEEKRLVCFYIG